MTARTTISNFIGGSFVPPRSAKYIDSFNPAKGEIHVRVPDSTAEDIELAVLSAEVTFETWSITSRAVRSAILYKIAELIESYVAFLFVPSPYSLAQ